MLDSTKYKVPHLRWIHDRMIWVHGEKYNYDYMIKLRELIDEHEEMKQEIDRLNFMIEHGLDHEDMRETFQDQSKV